MLTNHKGVEENVIAGTHIAFASTHYPSGAAPFEYEKDLIGWALAAAASLLPDADLPTCTLVPYLGLVAAQGEVYVQAWRRTGEVSRSERSRKRWSRRY